MTAPSLATSVTKVSGGLIRGAVADGVVRFLSIPYAANPVGELRFRAPRAHEGWEGVRDALTPGPSAPQHVPPTSRLPGLDLRPLFAGSWEPERDYLTVNVWAPEPDATGLPVMVFLHGGAFLLGGKDAALYDGSAFARGGVVLVTVVYRMGLEGFVSIPGGDSNLGLRDQIAALEWARDNAQAFGGDPANVTVFGESAGAMSIADLIVSPLAEGLFRRAIVQSGHGDLVRSEPTARRLTALIARRLKVAPDADGFRSRTIEDGVAAVEWAARPTTRVDLRERNGRDLTYGLSKFIPVVGDDVLPKVPTEALKAGAGAKVDLLIGTNRDEMNLYLVPTGVRERLSGLLAWFLLSRVQPHARAILKAYGLGRKGRKAGQAYADAVTDLMFRWPARLYAEAHQGRTHVYEFDWRSPACKGELGACHGLELGFVFNTLAAVTGPEGMAGEAPPQDLADRVHRLWIAFARDGSAPWPEYSPGDRQVYSLARGEAEAESPAAVAPFLT
ncbi:MAG TPA: carboxylesterase family protein [Caulobacteraceae bacterium]